MIVDVVEWEFVGGPRDGEVFRHSSDIGRLFVGIGSVESERTGIYAASWRDHGSSRRVLTWEGEA